MRSERWMTHSEKLKILKEDAAGPVLYFDNNKILTYDKEGHVMILGVSGSGKSRRCTIPMTMSFIKNSQSAIIVDAKGEIYANTKDLIPDCYDVHIINFRSIYEEKSEGWNPLYAPYLLWKSGSPKNRHDSEQLIEGLAHTIYIEAKNTDPFWIKEARNVFIAAVYSLFEYAEPEEINLASVYYLISKGDERFEGSTYLKSFVELSEKNENVTMQLQSYVTTANETRGGIRSTFLDGLSIATKSISIRNFLSHDELHINELQGDRSTLIFIIVPDETPIYDELTGVLVSQLMNHYIRLAEMKYNGKLPIRLNILLEELGNIGHAITNLPHLMSAGRSRNIRVEFVLQSISQLVDIYGESNATTILSNCDVRIAFRVNHWDTLTELSRICGEREVNYEGQISTEPLITQSQLAAMETGQALVIISGRYKFITWIPDFTEMHLFISKKYHEKHFNKQISNNAKYFDIQKFVKDQKRKQIEREFSDVEEKNTHLDSHFAQFNKNSQIECSNELINKINKRIAELEKEEEMEKEINNFNVTITSVGDIKKTLVIIKRVSGLSAENLKDVLRKVKNGSYSIENIKLKDAEDLIEKLSNVGTTAIISNYLFSDESE